MKKYYAKEIQNNDFFDYEMYFSEEDAFENHIWLGGNKEFNEINPELIENLLNRLDDYDTDCQCDEDALEDDEFLPVEAYLRNANNYFSKADGSELTIKDLDILTDCRENIPRTDDNAVICKLLEMIYDEQFNYGTFHGRVQSEWINYICPVSIPADYLKYIEAVIFETGTEYLVALEPVETPEEIDYSDMITVYTNKTEIDDLKLHFADILNCQPEEIAILNISDATATSYKYIES